MQNNSPNKHYLISKISEQELLVLRTKYYFLLKDRVIFRKFDSFKKATVFTNSIMNNLILAFMLLAWVFLTFINSSGFLDDFYLNLWIVLSVVFFLAMDSWDRKILKVLLFQKEDNLVGKSNSVMKIHEKNIILVTIATLFFLGIVIPQNSIWLLPNMIVLLLFLFRFHHALVLTIDIDGLFKFPSLKEEEFISDMPDFNSQKITQFDSRIFIKMDNWIVYLKKSNDLKSKKAKFEYDFHLLDLKQHPNFGNCLEKMQHILQERYVDISNEIKKTN